MANTHREILRTLDIVEGLDVSVVTEIACRLKSMQLKRKVGDLTLFHADGLNGFLYRRQMLLWVCSQFPLLSRTAFGNDAGMFGEGW